MATKDEIREAAEADLLTFIKLVAPHRVLGHCHEEVCRWWTREDAKENQMVLMPRDHQKSAMLAYRVAWEITKNPAVTILYISSTSNLAEKQLKFVKDIITSNVYRRYWPEMVHPEEGKREKWTSSEIAVDSPIRKKEGVRDPTVFTAGLTTSITGLHCNIACLDDVVVKENAYTAEGRKKVEDQYSLLSSIETTDAREWIVGTRYHPKDLYGSILTMEEDVYDEDGEPLDREQVYEVFQREVEDIGDGTGEFLWPRMQRGDGKWFGFNKAVLARKRAKYLDQLQFYAQYYNNPNDPGEEAIESENFQYYERQHIVKRDGVWHFSGKPLAVFAAIDFAYSLHSRADFTAIAVVGCDEDGNKFILDLERIKTRSPLEYYKLVYKHHMKWGFRTIAAEANLAQDVIIEGMKEEVKKDGLLLRFEKHKPTRHQGTKEERMQAILSPSYENGTVWHYAGGMCEELEQELKMHNPPHDDLKDALANALKIVKVPPKARSRREREVVVHGRFGGVAA